MEENPWLQEAGLRQILSVTTSTIVKAATFTNNPGALMKPVAATFLVALALLAEIKGMPE